MAFRLYRYKLYIDLVFIIFQFLDFLLISYFEYCFCILEMALHARERHSFIGCSAVLACLLTNPICQSPFCLLGDRFLGLLETFPCWGTCTHRITPQCVRMTSFCARTAWRCNSTRRGLPEVLLHFRPHTAVTHSVESAADMYDSIYTRPHFHGVTGTERNNLGHPL